jgi:hypothetical protein
VAPVRRCLLALGCLLVGVNGPVRAVETDRSTTEFQRICGALSESDNEFFGRPPIAELEARLAREESVETRGAISWALAREKMRRGDLDGALALLEKATAEQPESGAWKDRLIYMTAATELRRGEAANCIDNHNAASCILPLAPEGVHRPGELARRAGDLYAALWSASPGDPRYRWLLNLSRSLTGDNPGGVPSAAVWEAPVPEAPGGLERWVNLAPALGLHAWDLAGGAAMDDFDGDGLLDLISTTWDPCGSAKAWRNLGAEGFVEVTAKWGLAGQFGALNLVHADYDDDGDLDLYLLRGAWLGAEGRIRNSLLENRIGGPEGAFVDVTASAGLAYPAYPTQTAGWSDYDGDGDLDLYVGNESAAGSNMGPGSGVTSGRSYPSQLFRNNANGTFSDVARQAGVTNERFSKGVAWGDFDNDGAPDLYVSNIGPNRLYRNRGDGTFVDVAEALGVTEPAGSSLATWFFDYDSDGDLDIWVGTYAAGVEDVFRGYLGSGSGAGHPRLFRNEGGSFTDVSRAAGMDQSLLPMGANYGDLDGDGRPDIVLGTGAPNFDAMMPNVALRNLGGSGFEDVSFISGLAHLQKGHGVAFGDVDNDGDLDLFQQLGGAYPFDAFTNALYQNPGQDASWVVLRLRGRQANGFGVGARLAVHILENGATRTIHEVAGSGGSFGGSSMQQEIGLGEATRIESVEILWPGSGTRQTLEDLPLRRWIEITEGEAEYRVLEMTPVTFPLDVEHAHHAPESR